MKKLVVLLSVLMFVAMMMPVVAIAEENGETRIDMDDFKKEVNVDKILQRLEERKVKMLENIKERFNKLNERLATFNERINKASARREKFRAGKASANNGENKANTAVQKEEKLKERKAKITERYDSFKKNIELRKNLISERMEKSKVQFMSNIEKLSLADRARVIAARESMLAEIKAEAEKLAAEALQKLEATYQKLMSL